MNGVFTPEEIVDRIQGFGFRMFVGPDGQVHGKPVVPGTKVPIDMQQLLEEMRLQNDAVADVIRQRESLVQLSGLSDAELRPWLEKVRAGEYRLVGQVTYVKSTGLSYLTLERVTKSEE